MPGRRNDCFVLRVGKMTSLMALEILICHVLASELKDAELITLLPYYPIFPLKKKKERKKEKDFNVGLHCCKLKKKINE